MEDPSITSVNTYNPVTPDWLNGPESERFPASMEYWYPYLQQVDVQTPTTSWVKLTPDVIEEGTINEMYWADFDITEFKSAVSDVGGPPVFLKTDMAAAETSEESILTSLDEESIQLTSGSVIGHNTNAEIPFSSFAVRELLNTVSYESLDVEIRTIISTTGDVKKWGFYWPEKHVECSTSAYQQAREVAENSGEDVIPLAQRVADRFESVSGVKEGWSVDFILTENNGWYCTDMAPARFSTQHETLMTL